jgi:hypothetical protein
MTSTTKDQHNKRPAQQKTNRSEQKHIFLFTDQKVNRSTGNRVRGKIIKRPVYQKISITKDQRIKRLTNQNNNVSLDILIKRQTGQRQQNYQVN